MSNTANLDRELETVNSMIDKIDAWEGADSGVLADLHKQSITIEQLDAMIRDMAIAKEKYESAKDVSNAAEADYQILREKIIAAMDQVGKSKYHVDGIGTVIRTTSYKVTTPKDLNSKQALLDYFKSKGEEVYLAFVGVNYQSLNAFYNQEAELAKARGQTYSMPGVDAPVADENIRFTKERSKK